MQSKMVKKLRQFIAEWPDSTRWYKRDHNVKEYLDVEDAGTIKVEKFRILCRLSDAGHLHVYGFRNRGDNRIWTREHH